MKRSMMLGLNKIFLQTFSILILIGASQSWGQTPQEKCFNELKTQKAQAGFAGYKVVSCNLPKNQLAEGQCCSNISGSVGLDKISVVVKNSNNGANFQVEGVGAAFTPDQIKELQITPVVNVTDDPNAPELDPVKNGDPKFVLAGKWPVCHSGLAAGTICVHLYKGKLRLGRYKKDGLRGPKVKLIKEKDSDGQLVSVGVNPNDPAIIAKVKSGGGTVIVGTGTGSPNGNSTGNATGVINVNAGGSGNGTGNSNVLLALSDYSSGPGSKKRNRAKTNADLQVVVQLCGQDGNGGELEAIKEDVEVELGKRKKLRDATVANYEQALKELNALKLSVYGSCREQCANALLGNIPGCEKTLTKEQVCKLLPSDLDEDWIDKVVQVDGGCTPSGTSKNAVCEKALGLETKTSVNANGDKVSSFNVISGSCGHELLTANIEAFSDCADFGKLADAYSNVLAAGIKLKNAEAELAFYVDSNCNVAYDVDVDSWSNKTPACIDKAINSCSDALKLAYADVMKNRSGTCAFCEAGMSSAQGKAMTAAAIMGAIGNIAVPLGLGGMQMAMMNGQMKNYNSLYLQQLSVCNNVGIPCPPPQMGGMGGFGGGIGINPMLGMGGMGMGGIGINPMLGMGGMGMGGGLGMGGLGMGMGMNPMLGMGMNPMMGMGGGLGMNGMGLNLGLGLNMGMNPMMGMGMNPMMGMGMNPMMGMGMNPMMFQQNAQQQQMNYMQMQQQMWDNQVRMQEMMNMQMMASSPYAMMNGNMGMGGFNGGIGINPMMNGSMGINPWSMNANPWNAGPGLNAGVNLNFNAGFNGGLNNGFNNGFNGFNNGFNGGFNNGLNTGFNGGSQMPYPVPGMTCNPATTGYICF